MRRPLAILAAVLLSVPTLRAFLDGHLDPTTTATRVLVALAFAWAGAALLAQVVAGYGAQPSTEPDGADEAGAADGLGDEELDPALG